MKTVEFKLSKKLGYLGKVMTFKKTAMHSICEDYGRMSKKFWIEFMKAHPELSEIEMMYDSTKEIVVFAHDSDERKWNESNNKES